MRPKEVEGGLTHVIGVRTFDLAIVSCRHICHWCCRVDESLSFRNDSRLGRLVKREDGMDVPEVSPPIELGAVVTKQFIVMGTGRQRQ
jgi:hypothetical protein